MVDLSGLRERIIQASSQYPKPAGLQPSYGTAGFRCESSLLSSTAFRCGLMMAARARLLSRTFGIMVTASHNPVNDNGLKLIEPSGEMPPPAWEAVATSLACAESDQLVADLVVQILQEQQSSEDTNADRNMIGGSAHGPGVLLGHDTRPSAEYLVAATRAGVEALNVAVHDAGLVTTPQLHFMAHASNASPLVATLEAYFETLIGAYEALTAGTPPLANQLHVDCANGVGAHHLLRALPRLAAAGLAMRLHNTGNGKLNHACGADFVQKERLLPSDFTGLEMGDRCCSIDGDADRLVYFSHSTATAGAAPPADAASAGCVQLLDGDKIAALTGVFISDQLRALPTEVAASAKVGVVQTAYANGASTSYITRSLGLQVECTSTGVKHLHKAAHRLDVGVYWEANGHGTVLFSAALLARLRQLTGIPAARDMLLLSRMINQTVGDAISGILLVEAILRYLQGLTPHWRKAWSLPQWQALYGELPSRMTKLRVADRSVFVTEDAERQCVSPVGLQPAIDALVKLHSQARWFRSACVGRSVAHIRSFVRPSGTEDVVRVYAEAATQAEADDLARQVGQVVYDLAGGVGPRP